MKINTLGLHQVKLPLALMLMVSSLFAATAPYLEDFDSGSAPGFATAGTSGAYTLQAEATGYSYQAELSATSGSRTASAGIQITNLVGTACLLSTDFTLTSFAVGGNSVVNGGFGFFSDSENFSTGSQYRIYYQINPGNVGRLQLMKGSTQLAVSELAMEPRLNMKYTLSVVLGYVDGSLSIQGFLDDDTSTIAVACIDTAPLGGTYLGYRTAIYAGTGPAALTILYDNFDVYLNEGGSVDNGYVTGNLSVGGALSVSGNTFSLGASGQTFGAELFYDSVSHDFSSRLSSANGTWSWFRGSSAGMALDAQNQLCLWDSDDGTLGVVLSPAGTSEFKSVRVNGSLSVGGSLRIAPQGDLLMGDFTAGTNPAQ